MRTKLRNIFRYRHKLASIGLFFRTETRANPAVFPGKPINISYLDDAQFFLPLSCDWHCLFRRQALPGHHFRSQVQLGNELDLQYEQPRPLLEDVFEGL
jgi:hypothetical protein